MKGGAIDGHEGEGVLRGELLHAADGRILPMDRRTPSMGEYVLPWTIAFVHGRVRLWIVLPR